MKIASYYIHYHRAACFPPLDTSVYFPSKKFSILSFQQLVLYLNTHIQELLSSTKFNLILYLLMSNSFLITKIHKTLN